MKKLCLLILLMLAWTIHPAVAKTRSRCHPPQGYTCTAKIRTFRPYTRHWHYAPYAPRMPLRLDPRIAPYAPRGPLYLHPR